jgi:acyl carrier protein
MSMQSPEIVKAIRQFILENYLFTDDDAALDDEVSFLESGLLDSTGMMELVMFMEDSFGVTVSDDEMIPDNLDSVVKAAAFASSKVKAA